MGLPSVSRLLTLPEADLRGFRERVDALGYRPELLAEAEAVAPGQLDAVSLPLVRWELARRGDAASRLMLLFAYGEALKPGVVETDLGAALVAQLAGAGLFRSDGRGGLRCPFRIVPLEGLLVLGDEPSSGTEAVMGPGPTTLELVSQLPLSCSGPALDLGTGAGSLALLLAARGAGPVLGTDINPRAAAVGAFNARLNGLTVEFRTGDLDAPVLGERFGWVVSQPAYVLRPDDTPAVTFLHGGRRGDELAFRLLSRLPTLLAAEGTALVLFETPVDAQTPLSSRLRTVLGTAPVDVVVLAAPGLGAGAQAVGYAALEAPDLGPRYAEALQRYRNHLAVLSFKEWTHALVVLRANPQLPPGGRYTVQLPVKTLSQDGPQALLNLLGALEVASLPDDKLLAMAVAFQPRAKLVEERTGPGVEPVRRVTIERGAFGTERIVTDAGLALLETLEQATDVAEAVDRYAELCDAQATEVRSLVLNFVREGLGRGLLLPRELVRRSAPATSPSALPR